MVPALPMQLLLLSALSHSDYGILAIIINLSRSGSGISIFHPRSEVYSGNYYLSFEPQ